MKPFKGTIALDIDGTITVHHHSLDPHVKKYLENLSREGWRLFFVTGRTFSFSQPILEDFQEPYWIAPQNGAAIYEMPGEKLIAKHFLSAQSLSALTSLVRQEGLGLLIESGRQHRDLCYYVPDDFSNEETDYLHFRMSITPEKWQGISSCEDYPFGEFAVGKFFAKEEVAKKLAAQIHLLAPAVYSVIVIRDPFRPGFHLAHINEYHATKGAVVEEIAEKKKPLIVAGDDYNDLDMLKKGDIKIVMGNAPSELRAIGDIIAPPAIENGILPALEEALQQL